MFQDKLDRPLSVGDTVAYVHGNDPEINIGEIVSFTAKKVRISRYSWSAMKDPKHILKVEKPDAPR